MQNLLTPNILYLSFCSISVHHFNKIPNVHAENFVRCVLISLYSCIVLQDEVSPAFHPGSFKSHFVRVNFIVGFEIRRCLLDLF